MYGPECRPLRAPGSVDMTIEMKVSCNTDLMRAHDDTRYWAALVLSAEEKISVDDPLETERLADYAELVLPRLRSAFG
jgi:coenzyme F420-dependent glucose-6-phosphate dehydrogenase